MRQLERSFDPAEIAEVLDLPAITWKQMTRRPHELGPLLLEPLSPAPGSRGVPG